MSKKLFILIITLLIISMNLFSNNNLKSFKPVNNLEKALIKALENKEAISSFLDELFVSDIYFTTNIDAKLENGIADDNTSIEIEMISYEDQSYYPIYSSLERLEGATSGQNKYIALNALTFFQSVGSETPIVLNPGYLYNKIFSSEMIEYILKETSTTFSSGTKVQLGIPNVTPHKLIDNLTRYFKKEDFVKKAYIAEMYVPSSGEDPHLLIGLDVVADFTGISAKVSKIFKETLPSNLLHITEINQEEHMHEFFINEITPFYSKE